MIIAVLSLAAASAGAAATCRSACVEALRDCKRSCDGSRGPARAACRTACAEGTTCTAPGARIRTLAYVVNECSLDQEGGTSLRQKLLIRRGNCDPIVVMETLPTTPVRAPFPVCDEFRAGLAGVGTAPFLLGTFQHMAVLPDGSGVVFEVTKQHSQYPPVTPEPPQGEGIYFVRADGRGLRRLGPPSRVPAYLTYGPLPASFLINQPTGAVFPVSPDGKRMALVDLGPDAAGKEAPQLFLMDLRSGRRRQLTQQSDVPTVRQDGAPIFLPSFIDNRTIAFYSGATIGPVGLRYYQVQTDGTGIHEISVPSPIEGGRVIPQFSVTSRRWQIDLVQFPDEPAVNPVVAPFVREVFLTDGKEFVQVTNFDRADTGTGGVAGFLHRGRVIFLASANPTGENPGEICQMFSVHRFGTDVRQITQLASRGTAGHCFLSPCGIHDLYSLPPDRITGTVLFPSPCDPVTGQPIGTQIFAMRPDGSGLRQLTMPHQSTADADSTQRVETTGPFAYPANLR